MPLSIEFWSDGKFRLHDRQRFDRETLDADWTVTRLYP
jgi:pyridoxamine 5'-phosphate oxidase